MAVFQREVTNLETVCHQQFWHVTVTWRSQRRINHHTIKYIKTGYVLVASTTL